MGQRSVVVYTTGEPGSGKSYRRCAHFLIKEFLPNGDPSSVFWSNYPVKFEDWTDGNGEDRQGLFSLAEEIGIERDEVEDRVKVFPPDEVNAWRPEDKSAKPRGPWSFFEENEISISNTHIAIDEIHNFCPVRYQGAEKAWQDWLGEIRHEGATVEFLTQSPKKVGQAIEMHAGLRRELTPGKLDRDPFFNIQLDDWYNFWTIFGKQYKPGINQVDSRQKRGKWEVVEVMPFWFDPKLYGAYDSFSAPMRRGAGQGAAAQLEPYQQMGKVALFFWFFRRNAWRLFVNRTVPRLAFVVGLMVLVFNFTRIIDWVQQVHKSSNGRPVTDEEKKKAEPTTQVTEPVAPVPGEIETKAENSGIDEELAELIDLHVTKMVAASEIVGLSPGKVIFADGRIASVGESVRIGLEELRISGIDYEKRMVHFDGGFHLHFQRDHGMSQAMARARNEAANLRSALRKNKRNKPDSKEVKR